MNRTTTISQSLIIRYAKWAMAHGGDIHSARGLLEAAQAYSPVIHANLARFRDYPNADLDPLGRVIDLFDDIRRTTGRWYKLDTIAEANLNRRKIAHGQQAAKWLRSGDTRRVVAYCRDDVELVRDLYQILARGEALRLPPRPERGETEELQFRLA